MMFAQAMPCRFAEDKLRTKVKSNKMDLGCRANHDLTEAIVLADALFLSLNLMTRETREPRPEFKSFANSSGDNLWKNFARSRLYGLTTSDRLRWEYLGLSVP